MSSSTGNVSKKIGWARKMYGKINHENQVKFQQLRAEAKAKDPKNKKVKKESLPKE